MLCWSSDVSNGLSMDKESLGRIRTSISNVTATKEHFNEHFDGNLRNQNLFARLVLVSFLNGASRNIINMLRLPHPSTILLGIRCP